MTNSPGNIAQVREAVGVFDSADTLEAAIDELEISGFDRADLSLLASAEAVEAKLGHRYEKVSDLEDDPVVPTTAYVSRNAVAEAEGALVGSLIYLGAVPLVGAIVASGGTAAAAILAAVIGSSVGGMAGLGLSSFVGLHHENYLQKQLDAGGLLLWVRTRDAAHEARATEILGRHSAHDVHVHGLPDRTVAEAIGEADVQ